MASTHRDEISRLELLHAAHPDGLVFPHLADAYRRAGRFAQAEGVLTAGLRRHAEYSSAHVVLGRLRLDQGKREEAREAFSRVLELDPHNHVALEYLGRLAEELGRPDQAAHHFRRLARLKPGADLSQKIDRLERLAAEQMPEPASEEREGSGTRAPGPATPGPATPGPGTAGRPGNGARGPSAGNGPGPMAPSAPSESPTPPTHPATRPDPGPSAAQSPVQPPAQPPEPSPAPSPERAPGIGRAGPAAAAEPPLPRMPEPGEVVTETMAELYARQGLYERAAMVYRQLLDRRPDDRRLRSKLGAVEAHLHPAAREGSSGGRGPTAAPSPRVDSAGAEAGPGPMDEPRAATPGTDAARPRAEQPTGATRRDAEHRRSEPARLPGADRLPAVRPEARSGEPGSGEPGSGEPGSREPGSGGPGSGGAGPSIRRQLGALLTWTPEPELGAEPEPELGAEPEPELGAEPEPGLGPSSRPEAQPRREAEGEPEREDSRAFESWAGSFGEDAGPRQEGSGTRLGWQARSAAEAGWQGRPAASAPATPEAAPQRSADANLLADRELGDSEASSTARSLIAISDMLVGLLEFRDPFFRGSSSLTRLLAEQVAGELGLSAEERVHLALATVLRDLGRLAMGGRLVPVTDSPTPEARRKIERHVDLALHLLEGVELPRTVRLAVRHHHERWDGGGYPDGLSAEGIPLLARVLAVVDSFGAMISPRSYRLPRKVPDAAREVEEASGTQYDPTVVAALMRVLARRDQPHLGFVQRPHVLMVDPDQPGAVVSAAKLCSAGYLAEVSGDPGSARERLRRVPVSALVVSAEVGADEAAELVRNLRVDPLFASLPVVVIEAETVALRVRLLESGADVCFPPGTSHAELQGTLGALVRRSIRGRVAAGSRDDGGPAQEAPWLALQGDVEDFPLTWLLQVMKYDSRTAAIGIRAADTDGAIYLKKGDAVHAQIRGGSKGEAALREMLQWEQGRFTVQPDARPREQTIDTSIMHLLLTQAVDQDHAAAGIFGAVSDES